MSEEDDAASEGEAGTDPSGIDIAGEVRDFTTPDWPSGYVYGATRYADVILRESFPHRFADLVAALTAYRPTLDELRAGGGGRTVFTRRFDESLGARVEDGENVWGKRNITIEKMVGLEGTVLRKSRTRGHEIDMFGMGCVEVPLPGIAVEMEWNNKDPFYDRDLNNFQALHREGAIAIGVIVTRGPGLQALIGPTIRSKDGGLKYGKSSTHWDKLIPKVNLGGGGECPLLLIGIEPERIDGIHLAQQVKTELEALDLLDVNDRAGKVWRERGQTYRQWQAELKAKRNAVKDLMPPVNDESSESEE